MKPEADGIKHTNSDSTRNTTAFYGRYASREGHVSFSNLSTRAKATTASKQLNNQHENNDNYERSQHFSTRPNSNDVNSSATLPQISIFNLQKASSHITQPLHTTTTITPTYTL
jgi:hypothetical protein